MKMKKVFLLAVACIFLCVSSLLAEEGKRHVVKKGDTLSEICFKLMENGTKNVYEREAERLGIANPHLIYPGQTFNFPFIYRVVWQSKETDDSGYGYWHFDERIVNIFVNKMNQESTVDKGLYFLNEACPKIEYKTEKK